MKLVFLVVACALACRIEADKQMELDRRSKFVQHFKSYMVGFFEESDGISNGDCDYFSALGLFSSNRDIYKLSRLLNSWMCDSPITKLLAEIAQGTSQLTRMFLKVVKSRPKKESKTESNSAVKEVTATETPTTTVKNLAIEEMVLYVGSDKDPKQVGIYNLVDGSKGFELRASLSTSGQHRLLTDPTGKLLIVVNGKDFDVFNLNGETGQPTLLKSNKFTKDYTVAAFDNSGKYLLVSHFNSPAHMDAMQLEDDGTLTVIAEYIPTESEDWFPNTFAVHPKANGILAVPYGGTNVVRLLKFDSESRNIKLLSPNAPVNWANWVVFSNDGQYMYVTDNREIIYAFKLTVDKNSNEVTKVDPIGTFGTSQADTYDNVMIISPSGKFLYELSWFSNSIIVYKIDLSTGQLTPNGVQPTTKSNAKFMAISPEGTKLVVSDLDAGVIVFNIKEDGTLEQPKIIPDTQSPRALLLTKK